MSMSLAMENTPYSDGEKLSLLESAQPKKIKGSLFRQILETLSILRVMMHSNFKAYTFPTSLFAFFGVASGRCLAFTSGRSSLTVSAAELLFAMACVVVYISLWIFYFDCSNQRSAESVEEDRVNKPERPVASGRMTLADMQRWYVLSCVLLPLAAVGYFGGLAEALAFMAETWVYDNFDGDATWWGRNIINALFTATGQLGATRVAAAAIPPAGSAFVSGQCYQWILLLVFKTLTTNQIQDIRDVEGDSARGRRTLPVVIGDAPCRWLTAAAVLFWAVVASAYWSGDRITAAYVLPALLGGLISFRLLSCRNVKADKFTYRLYTLAYEPALYAIPLLCQFSVPGLGGLRLPLSGLSKAGLFTSLSTLGWLEGGRGWKL